MPSRRGFFKSIAGLIPLPFLRRQTDGRRIRQYEYVFNEDGKTYLHRRVTVEDMSPQTGETNGNETG